MAQSQIKCFRLPSGENLSLWSKDGELCGIACKNGKPVHSNILCGEDIKMLLKGKNFAESAENRSELKIGFFNSKKLTKCVQPTIILGKKIGQGMSAKVFECIQPQGYVLKIQQLYTIEELRTGFLKEVDVVLMMGLEGIGPEIESFWICDGVNNVEGVEGFKSAHSRGESFGFILSKKMDMTFGKFLKEHPESYYDDVPENKKKGSAYEKAKEARRINREKVQAFASHFEQITLKSNIIIHDLDFRNIMVNVEPFDNRNSEAGYRITEIRVVDFGQFSRFSFNLKSLLELRDASNVKQMRKTDTALSDTLEQLSEAESAFTKFKGFLGLLIEGNKILVSLFQ